jgi:hypothetical protein
MDVEDDSYQTLAFFYNREMEQLMVANTIINEVDAKDILELDDEEKIEVPNDIHGRYQDGFKGGT